MDISLQHYLAVAAMLFTIGVFGIFVNRKNVIIILMSVELILLAVNINFVAFSAYLNDVADKHWPKAESAGPVGFMGTVATGVRWLGALSLFGVVGVGLRQLIRPTGEASHEEKRKGS